MAIHWKHHNGQWINFEKFLPGQPKAQERNLLKECPLHSAFNQHFLSSPWSWPRVRYWFISNAYLTLQSLRVIRLATDLDFFLQVSYLQVHARDDLNFDFFQNVVQQTGKRRQHCRDWCLKEKLMLDFQGSYFNLLQNCKNLCRISSKKLTKISPCVIKIYRCARDVQRKAEKSSSKHYV